MEKKRFILFGFDRYYPGGGMDDAITTFDIEEYEDIKEYEEDWDMLQIFDTETNTYFTSEEMNKLPQIDTDVAVYLEEEDDLNNDMIEVYGKIDDETKKYLNESYKAMGNTLNALNEHPEIDYTKPIQFNVNIISKDRT